MENYLIKALSLLPIIIAITFHEAAHGFVAYLRGDDTAYRMGRLTFNPLKHVDPIGTIFLPLMLYLVKAPFLFGYAKPVPVNFYALKNRRLDTALVALAGPFTNFLLAYLALVVAIHFLPHLNQEDLLFSLLKTFIQLNIVLGVFNLLPLPPLDGGRVIMTLMPGPLFEKAFDYDRLGMMVLLGLLFILPLIFESLGFAFSPFGFVLEKPIELCFSFLIWLAGG